MSEFSKPFLNTTLEYPQDQFDSLRLVPDPKNIIEKSQANADPDGEKYGYKFMGMSQTYPEVKVYYAPNEERKGWYLIFAVEQSGGRKKSRRSRRSRKSRRHRKRTYKRR